MRRIGLHGFSSALASVAVLLVSVGCTGDSLETFKQLTLSTPNTQQEEQDTSSYTSKASNALGSYYDNTVMFLTDDCGVGAYFDGYRQRRRLRYRRRSMGCQQGHHVRSASLS